MSLIVPSDVETEFFHRCTARLGRPALIAGADEVGRGPLAGPVVAAAVVLDETSKITGLRDSKRLNESQRERLYEDIQRRALAVGVAVVEAPDIDATDILRASLRAMARAVEACERALGSSLAGVLVDGNQMIPLDSRLEQQTVVGGDARCPSIMAASIVAKVTRDRRMVEEAQAWPGYGFERHKGYPTQAHRAALARLGPCPLHRRTFAPVRAVLEGDCAERPERPAGPFVADP